MQPSIRFRHCWLVVVILLGGLLGGRVVDPPCAFGQSETASVFGRVTDQSGGVVPDVEVEIKNVDTNVSQVTKTNGEGQYVFPVVKPGNYLMNVRKQSFRTVSVTGVTLNVQDNLSRNFVLQVGSSAESITVTADSLNINTTDGAVSTVIDRNFVEALPLNGRSFNTLLQLTPGVVIAPIQASLGQFSVSGQRTDANNFTVDGVSANFGVGGGVFIQNSGTGGVQAFSALGGTSSLVSVDALQEFRIETSSFAPEFGKTPGGQVILTTRSGTNDFHGGAFDYFRNTVMDANNWFNNATIVPATGKSIPRTPEHHNDFGGFLGGPIQKDKTFFFLSYEGARLDQPQTQVVLVPSEFARTSAPAALAPLMNAYPQPDDRTVTSGVFVASFTGSFSNRATLDATSLRIDHTFGDRFAIFGRYNYAPSQIIGPSFSLSTLGTTQVNTQTLTVGLNMALSARLSNTLRGNYSAQSNNTNGSLDSFGGAIPLNSSFLLASLPPAQNQAQFFDLNFPSSLFFGSEGKNRTRQADFTDDLTLSVGTHQLQFGGNFRAIFLNVDPARDQLTYFVFDTASFLSGPSAGSTFLFDSVFQPTQFLSRSVSVYGQDRWKVTPRLSLTYGIRWELSPAPSPRGSTTLAAWANINNPAQIALAPPGTPVWTTKYGNVAPRLGIAYSLTSKGDLVLRAGAGIFYDLGIGSSATLAFKFPNSTGGANFSATVPVTDITPTFLGLSPQPPYQAVAGYSPDLQLPRSYQWNLALEKSFGSRQAISATYVGQAGRNLLRQEALFKPNASFLSDFILTLNDARSNYNALQLQYRRPLASRLQALLNYSWSHSLDNVSDDASIGLSNSVVISGKNDYASSDFDVRHSFSGALSYDVPAAAKSGPLSILTKNWSVNTVIVARSGFPFNAFTRVASLDPGGTATARPDHNLGQPYWIALPGAPGGKVLNAAAFSIPSTPRQGTEGRNDIPGLGLTQVDLSVARTFPITERLKVQFRADAFNVLNHPNFANPGAFVNKFSPLQGVFEMANQGLGGLNPLFQEGGPRSLQLSLRMTF